MSALFTPYQLGPVTLRNRTIRSAAFESMGRAFGPTEQLKEYHVAVARGGASAVDRAAQFLGIEPLDDLRQKGDIANLFDRRTRRRSAARTAAAAKRQRLLRVGQLAFGLLQRLGHRGNARRHLVGRGLERRRRRLQRLVAAQHIHLRQQEALARQQAAAVVRMQRDVDRLVGEAIRSGKAQRL